MAHQLRVVTTGTTGRPTSTPAQRPCTKCVEAKALIAKGIEPRVVHAFVALSPADRKWVMDQALAARAARRAPDRAATLMGGHRVSAAPRSAAIDVYGAAPAAPDLMKALGRSVPTPVSQNGNGVPNLSLADSLRSRVASSKLVASFRGRGRK